MYLQQNRINQNNWELNFGRVRLSFNKQGHKEILNITLQKFER